MDLAGGNRGGLERRIRMSSDPPVLKISRRNLLSLLHKLDMEGSHRTILKPYKNSYITIQAEEDDAHYNGRMPGIMHPETEQFIQEQ